jgi:hypothetical protein
MMGPGDRSPEEEAEELINSSDETVEGLAEGTEVEDQEAAEAEEEAPAEESEDLGEDDNEL